jgi:hypothetical protein
MHFVCFIKLARKNNMDVNEPERLRVLGFDEFDRFLIMCANLNSEQAIVVTIVW